MFSPFRAPRPEEEPGSGGKAPRRRRREAPASPYARPESSGPATERPAGNPRWFSGIVTRAGRLLSSVFGSDSSESSSSYSSDAEGGGRDSSDEDENADAHTEIRDLDETRRSIKSCTVHGEGPELITQRSERRLAIEKLLLQETFSRDEGDRLVKIIESRIVDTTEGGNVAGQKKLPDKATHNDLTLTGTWRSVNRRSRFPEGLAYSANHLSGLSPGTSILHAYSHDLCNKAIMEAKQWLEKKKMESTLKAELDSGPCTLNTDALQYRMEDEAGSPVDIAKSYMRERPPWQSPILSSIGFKTPVTGMHPFEDETPHTIFSTSKAMKRSYLTTDFDDARTVRLKSTENPPDSAVLDQGESSIATLEHEACQTADERNMVATGTNQDLNLLSAIETSKQVDASVGIPEKLADEDRVVENSPDKRAVQENKLNSLPSSVMNRLVDSSANVAADAAAEDDHPGAVSGPHNVTTFEVNHSMNDEVNAETGNINETHNLVSANSIPDPEDNVNGVSSNNKIVTQTVLPPEKEIGLGSLSSVSDWPDMGQTGARKDFSLDHESEDIFIFETSQDLEAPPPVEKQAKNVSVLNESASQETSANHNGARDFVELLNVELEELASNGVNSPSLSNSNRASDDPKIHPSGVNIDSSAAEIRQDHRSLQSEPTFDVEDTPVETRLVDGEDHIEKEEISAAASTVNGDLSLQPGSSSSLYAISFKKGTHRLRTPSKGSSAASIRAETRQLSTDALVDAPVGGGTGHVQKPQNGTTMKSIEQVLAENSPNSRYGRGKKVAARGRRGRGRGK